MKNKKIESKDSSDLCLKRVTPDQAGREVNLQDLKNVAGGSSFQGGFKSWWDETFGSGNGWGKGPSSKGTGQGRKTRT